MAVHNGIKSHYCVTYFVHVPHSKRCTTELQLTAWLMCYIYLYTVCMSLGLNQWYSTSNCNSFLSGGSWIFHCARDWLHKACEACALRGFGTWGHVPPPQENFDFRPSETAFVCFWYRFGRNSKSWTTKWSLPTLAQFKGVAPLRSKARENFLGSYCHRYYITWWYILYIEP